MPNPSTLAAADETLLVSFRTSAKNLTLSKHAREYYLAKARKLEIELGLPHEDVVHSAPQPAEGSTSVTLTYAQLSTVLAALRLAQTNRDEFETFDHFADVDPLTDEEIDALCEYINCA